MALSRFATWRDECQPRRGEMKRDEMLRQHANTVLAAMDTLSQGGFAARDPTRKMLAHFAIRKAAEEILLTLDSPCACGGREPIAKARGTLALSYKDKMPVVYLDMTVDDNLPGIDRGIPVRVIILPADEEGEVGSTG